MKFSRGIPDDTPENIVRSMLAIIDDEVKALGAVVERETKREGLSISETIDVSLGDVSVRILLNYVESSKLHLAKISIGTGSFCSGWSKKDDSWIGEHWRMKLLPAETFSPVIKPPFRWGLYPRDASLQGDEPTHILDGQLLRTLLRERLRCSPRA